MSGYEKLQWKWFEKKEFDDNNYMYKAIIHYIKYQPDEIYLKNDGYIGNGWIPEIFDSEK